MALLARRLPARSEYRPASSSRRKALVRHARPPPWRARASRSLKINRCRVRHSRRTPPPGVLTSSAPMRRRRGRYRSLASEFEIPYVETLHGMHAFFDAPWISQAIERRNAAEAVRIRKVASVIAVSELVRQQYLAISPEIEPARVVTVPNGVEISRVPHLDPARCRDWLGLDRSAFLFVSLARYSPQKNTYGLISAFDEVAAAYPEAHLLIAGRPGLWSLPTSGRATSRRAAGPRTHTST